MMGALTVYFKDLSSFLYVHGILNDVKTVFKRRSRSGGDARTRNQDTV